MTVGPFVRPQPRKAAALAVAFLGFLVLVGLTVPAPSAAQQQGAVFVDSIKVEGNTRLATEVVLGVLALQPGTSMTYRDIQKAIKDLWATGQFTDIQVRAAGGGETAVELIFDVVEQNLVRNLVILGLESASQGEVQDTADLGVPHPYSPSKVAFAKEFIRTKLAEKGIPFVQIEERTQPVPEAPGEITLFLDVTEGHRVTVADVVVHGNEILSEDDISGSMAIKPEGFWWFRTGSFEQNDLETDLLARLPDAYAAQGFLDFRVLGDTLIVDPSNGKARLELTVEEGLSYRLADFSVEGNSRFPTAVLRDYFQLQERGLLEGFGIGGGEVEEHPVFNQNVFDAATGRIQELYSDNGYLYATVEPWMEKHDTVGPDGPLVSVGWRIVEGNPAYVRRVAVEGNDYTHEWVVRDKIFLLPGDVFSRQLLIQSYQSISSLGFFEAPLDPPDVQPTETGDVDIIFHVAERQTGSVNFGTAVGGGTGLSGFIGYDQPNLFGQAKEGHIRWDFGRYQNHLSISFQDPALFQSRVSGSVSVFAGRDRFFSFQTGERLRSGINFRFGFPIPGSLRSRFFLGYGLSRTTYNLREGTDDTSLFGLPPGTQSTVSLSVVRSTLNHPLFPTSGSRQTVGLDLTGGPVLGGDGDFTKWSAEGTWWVPVGGVGEGLGGPSLRFALGLSLRGGALFGDASIFPFERYWMGGVQFGQMLRGYDETSITPEGYFPERAGGISDIDRLGNAFLSLTAEYAARFGDNLSVSLFYDAGNTWRTPLEVDPARMFRGAGVGVQIVTPFGPLGLDYAYGFDKPVPGWQLHFRLGPGF